jgi:ABC-type multidrug transport system fused ATPase/permease subunit
MQLPNQEKMDFETIVQFLKTDIIGLIILGIFSSLIAGFVYDHLKNQIKTVQGRIRKKVFIKRLVQIAESFGFGARASYAYNGTTFQQAVLVGDYIIKTIVNIGWIVFYLLLSIATLIVIDPLLGWVPVVIFSFIITFRYKKLKQHLEYFDQTYRMAFGEQYFKDELEGQKQHWDKIFKGKRKKLEAQNN